MGNLSRRVANLEARQPAGLAPALKQWLGQPLSGAESAMLDDQAGIAPDFDSFDLSGMSPEFQAWLIGGLAIE